MSLQQLRNERHNKPLVNDQLNEVGLMSVCVFDLTHANKRSARWYDDEKCMICALDSATAGIYRQFTEDKFKIAEHRYTRRTGREIVMFYVYDVSTPYGQQIQRVVDSFGAEALRQFTYAKATA
mgnify:CR=1 FL=1